MRSTPSGNGDSREFLDIKPFIRYHPVIGYEYIPGIQQTLPRPGGGSYTITINSAGIRSCREFAKPKPVGVFRILAFGDSFAAGQYVSNEQRFSELLERRVPGLEVINFGLEGSGTDQQLLLFEDVGRHYEYDAILLLPFLQNIRRNVAEAREAVDPMTLERVLLPKPRFELLGEELVLRNVPVPQDKRVLIAGDTAALSATDADLSASGRLKSRLNRSRVVRGLKHVVYSLVPWEPFPEYKSPHGKAWLLMEAIIRRLKRGAGARPLAIVPVFYSSYVTHRMARNYLARFRALAEGHEIIVIDLLPYFKRLGHEAARCFQEPEDCHFSRLGHLVVADALQAELMRAGWLGRHSGERHLDEPASALRG